MAHFELVEKMAPNAVIKVVGVGGGGGNAVAHMVNGSVDGVEFITANTDSQAIKNCGAKLQLQLGSNVTKGLGAGANPEVGRQAALEDRERIIDALDGADMVFITAGKGGGTGTGGLRPGPQWPDLHSGPAGHRICLGFRALSFGFCCAGADWAADGGYSAMGPEQAVPAIPLLEA